MTHQPEQASDGDVENSNEVLAYGIGVRGTATVEEFGLSHSIEVGNWGTVATVHTFLPQPDREMAVYVPQTIAALATPRIAILGRELNPVRDHGVADIASQFVQGLTSPTMAQRGDPVENPHDRMRIVDIDDATPVAIFEALRATAPNWIPVRGVSTRIEYVDGWPHRTAEWEGETWQASALATLVGEAVREQEGTAEAFPVTMAVRLWRHGDDFVTGFVVEPETAFVIGNRHGRAFLEGDDRYVPTVTNIDSPVARLVPQFAEIPVESEITAPRFTGPTIMHHLGGCIGQSEDQISDYTVSSDDLLGILDMLLRHCSESRVFIKGWWALSADAENISFDPVSGEVELYWLDENGVPCHGEPGVSGQPGTKWFRAIAPPDLVETETGQGNDIDTIPAAKWAEYNGPSFSLGDYDAPGPHFAQFVANIYRSREDGRTVRDSGWRQVGIPSIVSPEEGAACLLPVLDLGDPCEKGATVPEAPEAQFDDEPEPEQHPDFGHERTLPPDGGMSLDERREYCLDELLEDF